MESRLQSEHIERPKCHRDSVNRSIMSLWSCDLENHSIPAWGKGGLGGEGGLFTLLM